MRSSDRCEICGKFKEMVYRNKKTGQKICPTCNKTIKYHDKSLHEKCSVCGNIAHVQKRNKKGKPICASCQSKDYRKDMKHHEKCVECEKNRPVHKRNKHNEPVCFVCYAKHYRENPSTHETCIDCHEKKHVVKRVDTGALCNKCTKRRQKKASLWEWIKSLFKRFISFLSGIKKKLVWIFR
jgi:hypothetical protein